MGGEALLAATWQVTPSLAPRDDDLSARTRGSETTWPAARRRFAPRGSHLPLKLCRTPGASSRRASENRPPAAIADPSECMVADALAGVVASSRVLSWQGSSG